MEAQQTIPTIPDHWSCTIIPWPSHLQPSPTIPGHPWPFPKQKKPRLAKTRLRSESVGVAPGYVEGPVWWIPEVYKQKPHDIQKKHAGGLRIWNVPAIANPNRSCLEKDLVEICSSQKITAGWMVSGSNLEQICSGNMLQHLRCQVQNRVISMLAFQCIPHIPLTRTGEASLQPPHENTKWCLTKSVEDVKNIQNALLRSQGVTQPRDLSCSCFWNLLI